MINFIPNDPLAVNAVPMRQQAARPNRPANRAGFTYTTPAPGEAVYAPGTADFLFWQSREAALAAVEAWETIDAPLTAWAERVANRRRLPLIPDQDDDLNAYYNGESISFFHHATGNITTYSGASTDVVAHETGHALLDSVRPDLWDSTFTEIGSFHEAFGDCMALVTAFFDAESRRAVLQASADLGSANFLESTAEDLSAAVRREYGPTHPASAPREALNKFRWSLPTTLPTKGGPSVLTAEVHSFGRVFSGCFFDTIRNVFATTATKTEADLLAAVQTAARILVAGVRQAPLVSRFYQSVGRSMVLADQTLNNGANRDAIRNAFNGHNVVLGTSAMLVPHAALAGGPPKFSARTPGDIFSAETVRDLKRRLDADPRSRLSVGMLDLGTQKVAVATHMREVSLTSVSRELKGVVALVPEQVMVGAVAKSAALMGAMPEAFTTGDEVEKFVSTLLDQGQLEIGKKVAAVAPGQGRRSPKLPTHRIATRGQKKILERVRFACRAGGPCGCCQTAV